MALTIVFGYSGYLLPWDSLAYGAAIIGINLHVDVDITIAESRSHQQKVC